jgi:hypothetical protein
LHEAASLQVLAHDLPSSFDAVLQHDEVVEDFSASQQAALPSAFAALVAFLLSTFTVLTWSCGMVIAGTAYTATKASNEKMANNFFMRSSFLKFCAKVIDLLAISLLKKS